MGFCILAAVLQWWHSKFVFFLHWQRVFCFSGVSLAIKSRILAGVLQGLTIISAFQSFRWQKKSHSRCGSIVKRMGFCILAAVLQWWHSKFAFFLHWQRVFCFSGMAKFQGRRKKQANHTHVFTCCVVWWNFRDGILAAVFQGLPIISVFQAFRWHLKIVVFCFSIVSPAKKNRILAADP